MTKYLAGATALLLVLLPGPGAEAADPPGLIGYQGVLRSASGAPLDGAYDMIFRFTDSPVGGTLLLTDYHTGPDAVVVSRGLFSTMLGDGTLAPGTESTLMDVFGDYSPVWVEVQVGAETLSPRVRIVSTGFALNAGRFGGQLPGGYLDTGTSAQTKQGVLISDAGLAGHASGGSTGVDGSTMSGTGVRGTSTSGYGTTYGVFGSAVSTSGTGVAGEATATSGDAWGVYGKTSSDTGVGVLGSALAVSGATEGVRGQSSSPSGKGVVGAAFATSGSNFGVYGESQSSEGTGVYGRATQTSGGTTGVGGESYSSLGTGVAGVAHASSGDAWGVYGATTSPDGYGVVSDGPSITAGDMYATGVKYFLAEHPQRNDMAIRYACLEGGEAAIFQRGTGRLNHGEARIELPEPFSLIASGRVSVQVTPIQECAGLYVPDDGVSAGGFTVRELGRGTSDAAFTWLVVAERAGRENLESVRPLSVSEKILTTPSLTPGEKTSLRRALAAGPAGQTGPASRQALYSALDNGDYDGACSILGSCSVDGAVAVGIGETEAVSDTDASERPRSVARPEPSTGLLRAGPTRPAAVAGGAQPLAASTLVEAHEASEPVEAGDVVVLDRACDGAIRPGNTAYDPGVIGVVTRVEGRVPSGEPAPVAIAGTVPCKVDADYGPIFPGDLLVVSPTPGHAMRAADPAAGTLVGKALESLPGGKGTIRVLVTLR